MNTLHPSLAARIVAQAREGSLVLTLDESKMLLDHLERHPRAAVVLPAIDDGDGKPTIPIVEIRLFPIHVLDPVDDPSLDFLSEMDDDDAWTRPHLASFLEGLLDVDDLRRLLP